MGQNNVSKTPGGGDVAPIENACVRKLAQKVIIIMKNKLTSVALILILTMMCILLGPKYAINFCPRSL